MNENKMFKPALIGGVLLGILSALPIIGLFNCVCCAWVIAGGILAARLYVKDSPVAVTLGRGALLGLLTGFIGSIVSTIFSMNLIEQLRERMKTMPNVPPETQALLDTLSNRSDINALMLIFGLIFTLIVFCLFAMLGSTIGVSIFEKRKVGTPPSDATSYEPPVNLPPPPDAHE
jgi:mannitol-specific phosphotransferase system IIBC component